MLQVHACAPCSHRSQIKPTHFGNQKLSGQIPATGWPLPPLLTSFQCINNNVNGMLPTNWALPSTLVHLYLSGSPSITGSIPQAFIDHLPNTVADLSLRSNMLTGLIPTDLVNLPALTNLVLANNHLRGACQSAPTHRGLTAPRKLILGRRQCFIQGCTHHSKSCHMPVMVWSLGQAREPGLPSHHAAGPLPTRTVAGTPNCMIKPGNDGLCNIHGIVSTWRFTGYIYLLHLAY